MSSLYEALQEDFQRYNLINNQPRVNTTEELADVQRVYTSNVLSDAQIITFNINGDANLWIDPSELRVYLKCKLVQEDGTVFPEFDNTDAGTRAASGHSWYLEPNIFHNLWKDITVKIQGKLFPSQCLSYAHKAYMEKILLTQRKEEDQLFELEGWYVPDGRYMDGSTVKDTNPKTDHEAAPKKRRETRLMGLAPRNANGVEFYAKINHDFFNVNKLLPPGVNVEINFERQSSAFWATTKTTKGPPKLVIENMYLVNRRSKPYSDVNASLVNNLMSAGAANYQLTRTTLRTFNISAGQVELTEFNALSGQVPTKIVVGLVKSTEYAGLSDHSPFKFRHWNVKEMYCVKGTRNYPSEKFETDFAKGETLMAWHAMKQNIFPKDDDFVPIIDKEAWSGGTNPATDNGHKTLWVIDLSTNLKARKPGDDYYNLIERQNTQLFIRSGNPGGFPEQVTCLILAYYENTYSIMLPDKSLVVDWS